jgi:dTDP-4-amino-4,6-dideoxygalactose transaminase
MCLFNDEKLYKIGFGFADKNYNRLSKDSMRNIPFLAPNYRMSELQGAVGIAQLKKLEWICTRRHEYGERITQGIKGLKGIYPPKITDGGESSYWFYMMRIDEKELGASRKEFSEALTAEGVPNQAGYIPNCVYEYDLFVNKSAYLGTDCPFGCKHYGRDIDYHKGLCPEAESILETAVKLNCSEFYTNQDADEVIEAIRKVHSYYISK